MQITSINQLLKQIYSNNVDIDPKLIENLQQIEQDTTSTLIDMKSDYVNNWDFIDEEINAAIVAFTLDIEPTAENLLYIKRLGFSMGVNLQRLIKYISEKDSRLLTEDIVDLLLTPEEVKELLSEFNENHLIDMADRIDLLLALARSNSGEYIDISTRLFIEPNSQEKIQQELDQIVEILLKLDMDITAENIELVDKFVFVFREQTLDVVQVLASLQNGESTLGLKSLMEKPEEFLKFYSDIHSYEQLIDTVNKQEIYHKISAFIDQIERYIRLFPMDEQREIINLFKEELLALEFLSKILYGHDEGLKRELRDRFESNLKAMENSNMKAALYTRIESDIGETLQLQLKDDFPFWLIPIFSQYENSSIFGELWIKKEDHRQKESKPPYNLYLWSDFDNLGRVDMCIYGIEQNIDVYMLCQSQVKNLIIENKENIMDILKYHNFSVGIFQILDPKSKGSILSYLLASSTGIDKDIDIRV